MHWAVQRFAACVTYWKPGRVKIAVVSVNRWNRLGIAFLSLGLPLK
jgi:hypothetical protein